MENDPKWNPQAPNTQLKYLFRMQVLPTYCCNVNVLQVIRGGNPERSSSLPGVFVEKSLDTSSILNAASGVAKEWTQVSAFSIVINCTWHHLCITTLTDVNRSRVPVVQLVTHRHTVLHTSELFRQQNMFKEVGKGRNYCCLGHYLSISLSIYLSICLSVCLSVCPPPLSSPWSYS